MTIPQTKRGIVSKRQMMIDATIGKRFNKLTVVSYNKAPHIRYRWTCQCDCGQITDAALQHLENGLKRSCGSCTRQHTGLLKRGDKTNKPAHNKLRDDSEVVLYRVFDSYKQHARYRDRIFDITFEQFKVMSQQDCFYCGLAPAQTITHRGNSCTYTGLDRIDSSRGYTIDNVRPCCKRCNIAKGDLSEQQFINWLQRAYKHMAKVGQVNE